MRTRLARRLSSEHGATLVHVAIALLSLMGITAFAVDRGIVWVGRGQAQNAADAGALAGATARGFDEFANPPKANGVSELAAATVATVNDVWGQPGAVTVRWTCPTGVVACARVDIQRDGLPAIFSRVLGVTSQGVRATATAVARPANATRCLRPIAIPDTWAEQGTMDANAYERWRPDGTELMPHDIYANSGRNFRAPNDIGLLISVQNSTDDRVVRGTYQELQLGGGSVATSVSRCTGTLTYVGDTIPFTYGGTAGAINAGVAALLNMDPGATFDTATLKVENSCAPACAPISPRIVPIAVYDTDEMQRSLATGNWSYCPSGNPYCAKIVQILGLFVTGGGEKTISGHLIRMPGERRTGAAVALENAFLLTISLVR